MKAVRNGLSDGTDAKDRTEPLSGPLQSGYLAQRRVHGVLLRLGVQRALRCEEVLLAQTIIVTPCACRNPHGKSTRFRFCRCECGRQVPGWPQKCGCGRGGDGK
jgi:hypothetical protein